jgi:1-aminocyclopropane-1-carboxylate deaminase
MLIPTSDSPLQIIENALTKAHKVQLFVKRDDLLHPLVSGNKFRKLKYNLEEAKRRGLDTILSFGGAYSNHIYALAAAGKIAGIKTIGVIRGEEFSETLNPTLSFARDAGMKLHFVSRSDFKNKHDASFIASLEKEFGKFFLVPEGGSNEYALPGCAEIIKEIDMDFNYICCPCGTGGTITGLLNGLKGERKALGFSALKGDGYIEEEMGLLAESSKIPLYDNYKIFYDYHFGGYGKINSELLRFMDDFENSSSIPLDPVYTAKMFYGIFDLMKNNYFPEHSVIVALHTGGLQGLEGKKAEIAKIKAKKD